MTQTKCIPNKEQALDSNENSWITIKGRRFHYVWLRDNCFSPVCRNPSSFEKRETNLDINQRLKNNHPLSVEITEEEVKIIWDENPPHESIFSIPWLLSNAYDRENGYGEIHQKIAKRHDEQILWDRDFIEANPPKIYDVQTDSADLWKKQLLTFGFARLRNIKDLTKFVQKIGPIRETESGNSYAIKVADSEFELTTSGDVLPAHNDYETYTHTANLLSFFNCVENEASGGESLLVDGFRVAEYFRVEYPEYFKLLSEVPIQFQRIVREREFYYRRTTKIIELDTNGRVIGIRIGNAHNTAWDLPFELMESYYEAYYKFLSYMRDPAYSYIFRLEPGDCYAIQNSRVLHGREAFDSSTGARQMDLACTEWDYLAGSEYYKRFIHLYLNSK